MIGCGGGCHGDCGLRIPYNFTLTASLSVCLSDLGLLHEGHRDTAKLCSGLEQFGLCLQHTGRDMAGHPPF